MKLFKKEKSQEELLKDMVTAEQIRCMNKIKQNAEEGKPESDNLILQKELSYYSSMEAENAKRDTERSNRRSTLEKVAATVSPFVVIGTAFWNASKDSKGENTTRTQGGRIMARVTESCANKLNDIKGYFKK